MNLFQIDLLFLLPVHTVKQVIDRFLFVYKVPCVLFNICVCERKRIFWVFFLCSFKFHYLLVWYGAAKINHTRKVASITVVRVADHFRVNHSIIVRLKQLFRQTLPTVHVQVNLAK
jgi:hypothetical protein